ncbi:hypothetical protein MVEG_11282 [Podila verticillata NRRL 6337]|uniref:Uncharacterized protein n=1 Tax=Podila verticillata NRRL 6337 TaxID=1069443 RepID=A0A086TLC9_9FUNG|nr:hypothetical protein MVEG_11282 [Podila verticillata NRRL 6337]
MCPSPPFPSTHNTHSLTPHAFRTTTDRHKLVSSVYPSIHSFVVESLRSVKKKKKPLGCLGRYIILLFSAAVLLFLPSSLSLSLSTHPHTHIHTYLIQQISPSQSK